MLQALWADESLGVYVGWVAREGFILRRNAREK